MEKILKIIIVLLIVVLLCVGIYMLLHRNDKDSNTDNIFDVIKRKINKSVDNIVRQWDDLFPDKNNGGNDDNNPGDGTGGSGYPGGGDGFGGGGFGGRH